MVSSECVPFAKSGGLADVVAALSGKLSSMGHDVRILLPEYSFLNMEKFKIVTKKLIVPMGFRDEKVLFSEGSLPGTKTRVLFAGHPVFTNRVVFMVTMEATLTEIIIIVLHYYLHQLFHILCLKNGYLTLFILMTGLLA